MEPYHTLKAVAGIAHQEQSYYAVPATATGTLWSVSCTHGACVLHGQASRMKAADFKSNSTCCIAESVLSSGLMALSLTQLPSDCFRGSA